MRKATTAASKTKSKQPLKPRPITESYLRNAAMQYISSRSATATMVRDTLVRRAKKRLMAKTLPEETAELIDATVAQLVKLQLIDDARFAEARATTLARKGLPQKRIALGLAQKGVSARTIAETSTADVDELTQARRFVERKRLGHQRRAGATPETQAKDLRALARAGFGYAIAVKALSAPPEDTE